MQADMIVGVSAHQQEPLHIVLAHLTGPDGSESLYNTVARGLHRTSKEHQSASRATLRKLRLDRWYTGFMSAHPAKGVLNVCDPSPRQAAIPWDLIAACPAATSWVLHVDQLASLPGSSAEQLEAAAAKLKQVQVLQPGEHTWDMGACPAELLGLSRLLQACSQLQRLDLQCATPLGALTSSLSSAVGSVHSLDWVGKEYTYWDSTQEEEPEEPEEPAVDLAALASWTGLRDLNLGTYPAVHSPSSISSLTRLTRLQMAVCEQGTLAAACALTDLRQLTLEIHATLELPSSMSALKQLTGLVMDCLAASIHLPADLGVWLPRLERLEVWGCEMEVFPASLQQLTYLSLRSIAVVGVGICLPSSLSSLKQLSISHWGSRVVLGISSLTGLELLDAAGGSNLLGRRWADLQPLTRLRHLQVTVGDYLHPPDFGAIVGMQQLEYLDRGDTSDYMKVDRVAMTQPLHVLRELRINLPRSSSTLHTLAPWLSRLTALTSLHVTASRLGKGDAMGYLPPQLQELGLGDAQGLKQLPSGLTKLSALTSLDVSQNRELHHLPSWLSQLRRLEFLNLTTTSVDSEQQVLGQMPWLRYVAVAECDAAEVFGAAPHLHWGHTPQV